MEYAIDVADACRERGVRSVAVTAGYMCEQPRAEFYRHMDAANVDLKAFTERFYRKICGGELAAVLETLEYLRHETRVWFEITTLLIIGLIVSISWGFQVVLALLSGVITDKLGRRLTTLIFDIVSWTIPSLISALAQNFWYFLIAGIINSVWRITHNSWSACWWRMLNPINSWTSSPGSISQTCWSVLLRRWPGFNGAFSFVPTMRGLYIFAAVIFTVKAIVTYQLTRD